MQDVPKLIFLAIIRIFQINESIMLVGDKESLSTLEAEYLSDEIYKLKVKDLATKYKNIRRTRPDGNCFFRAFAYAYFESLLDHKEDYNR